MDIIGSLLVLLYLGTGAAFTMLMHRYLTEDSEKESPVYIFQVTFYILTWPFWVAFFTLLAYFGLFMAIGYGLVWVFSKIDTFLLRIKA